MLNDEEFLVGISDIWDLMCMTRNELIQYQAI